jgi:IS30 family transposase
MVSIPLRPAPWEAGQCGVEHRPPVQGRSVERHTRYVMLAKVAGRDTQTVVSALIKQAKKLPKERYKSLTWDRGKELTEHRRFTLATKIRVYFCDPQSPWQRGSNSTPMAY